MKDHCAIEALIDLRSRDPIEVIAEPTVSPKAEWPAELRPKGSFEIAWELAH